MGRGGEESAPPFASLTGGEDFPGQLLRQQTITSNHSGMRISRVDQALQRHQQLQLNIDIGSGGLPGEAFHQGVGHDLIPAPAVPGGNRGVGVLPQCRITRDALLHRQIAGQHRHRVRGWPHPDPAMLAFEAAAPHIAFPIRLIRRLPNHPTAAWKPIRHMPAA